jgi:hypothetical protein
MRPSLPHPVLPPTKTRGSGTAALVANRQRTAPRARCRDVVASTAAMDLLLCASRTQLTAEHAAKMEKLVTESGLNWPLLAQLARRHKVLPLLHRNLDRTCRERMPPDIHQLLSQAYFHNAATNLSLASSVPRLIEMFETHAIRVFPYKGLDVALAAYGDLAARHIGDVDLLMSARDYVRASELLIARGFRVIADWGWERSFADSASCLKVDLHRSIAAPDFPIPVNLEEWRSRARWVDVRGTPMRCLSFEDLLLVLCIQVAKDGWVGRCELKKLCDIAELIRARPDLDWQLVATIAKRLGCERILWLGLALALDLLDASLPQELSTAIAADTEMDFLMRHVSQGMAEPVAGPEAPLSALNRFSLAIRNRWRDRLRVRYRILGEQLRFGTDRK